MTDNVPSTTAATTPEQLDRILDRARRAFPIWSGLAPAERARILIRAADALDEHADELIGIAMAETGLAQGRLQGELKRTSVQLRLFAEVIRDGAYLDVRLDAADPDFVLGPRPDLRRMLAPVGVSVNFSASNFPFAFSVAGGDTAAGLAAGCPVIVKAHSGHPELSLATARVLTRALDEAGAPEGTVQVVFGREAGVAVLEDDRVDVGTFTGSIGVGRQLADAAAARSRPIPFFGELGSVNPTFVTARALAESAEAIAAGFVTSVSTSAGQLSTKPGFLWVPQGAALETFERAVVAAAADVTEHRLLNPSIGRGFVERRDAVLGMPGVRTLVEGTARTDDEGQVWATITIVATDPVTLAEHPELLEETFGPMSVVVEYPEGTDLAAELRALYEGNLTGTVHAGEGEHDAALDALVAELAAKSGRVLFGGWPTGVSVTHAMQHGGPYPATTTDSSTSVGTAAISRFLRGVSYQNAPQGLLPEALRDDNPWGVPQARAAAGESAGWGRG